MRKIKFDYTRDGYGLRYFFNAGLNRETLACDEEGTDIFDAMTHEYLGSVSGFVPDELEVMTDEEFERTLEDNYIA